MKCNSDKPRLIVRKEDEKVFSDAAMIALLQTFMSKGIAIRFRASGFSMSPFIKDCDVITLNPISHRDLHRGKVVAFVQPQTGKLCVHRIVQQYDNAFIIRGDNLFKIDGLIPMNRIIGVVSRVERNGKIIRVGIGREGILIAHFWHHSAVWKAISHLRDAIHRVRGKAQHAE